ncbi:hypothetical protein ANN_03388 [Periplaneta americana]|uniref:Reverse transcriptase domain-containing protein n=1 Tax=Periplaneta americana TaxID=6978 RepID=A0ABQ8U325_PERAM|nr:hypothetical protein ANN_03388 [Periplaneta americana]
MLDVESENHIKRKDENLNVRLQNIAFWYDDYEDDVHNFQLFRHHTSNFSETSSDKNYDSVFLKVKYDTKIDMNEINADSIQDYNKLLTINELITSLDKCNSRSPGPDNISYDLLKHLPERVPNYLLYIYTIIYGSVKLSLTNGEEQSLYLFSNLIETVDPLNYRPISLTCTLCKLIEKIINNRLMWTLEHNGFFAETQCGFRHFHSTVDNLILLESEKWEAFTNSQQLTAATLDIEKAYDMIWKENVIKILLNNNIKGNMISFIYNFLQERVTQVRANGILSKIVPIQNGLPQGYISYVHKLVLTVQLSYSRTQPTNGGPGSDARREEAAALRKLDGNLFGYDGFSSVNREQANLFHFRLTYIKRSQQVQCECTDEDISVIRFQAANSFNKQLNMADNTTAVQTKVVKVTCYVSL